MPPAARVDVPLRPSVTPIPAVSGVASIKTRLDAAVVPSEPLIISPKGFRERLLKIQQDFRDLKSEVGKRPQLPENEGIDWKKPNILTELKPQIESAIKFIPARQTLAQKLGFLLSRLRGLGKLLPKDEDGDEAQIVIARECDEILKEIEEERRFLNKLEALRNAYNAEYDRRAAIKKNMDRVVRFMEAQSDPVLAGLRDRLDLLKLEIPKDPIVKK